jgi:DNA mismatch endonuclease (patch repair protein)
MTEDAAMRRRTMQAVRSKNTAPEISVRAIVRELGYQYRLHRADLPGKPDLAFIGRRKVIFVHGCFWHAHHCKRGARAPRNNRAYWTAKISKNSTRDVLHSKALRALGWRTLIIWECELKLPLKVRARVKQFIEKAHGTN